MTSNLNMNNFEFKYKVLRKTFEIFSNFEVYYIDFETLTSIFEVEKLNFETSIDFDIRNAEVYGGYNS